MSDESVSRGSSRLYTEYLKNAASLVSECNIERKHASAQSNCDRLNRWKKAIENHMQINHGQQWFYCLRNLRIGSLMYPLEQHFIPSVSGESARKDSIKAILRRRWNGHWRAAIVFFSVTTIFQTKGSARVKRRTDGKISAISSLNYKSRFDFSFQLAPCTRYVIYYIYN